MASSSINAPAVVVGVIVEGECVLISKRQAHQIMPGFWEFPGGKVEPGESQQDALSRELQEEIGIQVTQSEPWMVLDDFLHVYWVKDFTGSPKVAEGQEIKWVKPETLKQINFLKANTRIIDELEMMVESLDKG